MKTTGQIALGEAAGLVVMVAVFALLGQFDYTVVTGALLGGAGAVLNFFLLALTVKKSAGCGVQGKNRMILSIPADAADGRRDGCGNHLSVFPLAGRNAACYLMPTLTIYAMRLLGLYRPEQGDS
ncbi:MAG: ATP synthase subunit I [Ruthenibacterium lactatiformans]